MFISKFHEEILTPLSKDFPELFGNHIFVKGRPIASRDNYAWALTMVASRTWGPEMFTSLGDKDVLHYMKDEEIHVLSPVAELMNFGSGGGCIECEGWYAERGLSDPETMSFVCKITCPIKKGEEAKYWYNDDCKQGETMTMGNNHVKYMCT